MDIIQTDGVSLNRGQGVFSFTPSGETFDGDITVGDMNRDHRLDVISSSQVYWNDGAGGFTKSTYGDNGESVAVGDVNGDAWLDIVQGNFNTASRVYLNNGEGGFTLADSLDPYNTRDIALGDMNGDNALDIILGNDGEASIVYLNDGLGNFNEKTPLGEAQETWSITVGDVNSDGLLDIIQGNRQGASIVYLNHETGGFDAGTPLGNRGYTYSIIAGDINNDKALDIIQGDGDWCTIYLNDGQGGFGTGIPFCGSGNGIRGRFAFGDVNNDGALDIIQGNQYSQSYVYPNLRFSEKGLPDNAPVVAITRPGLTGDANFYSTPEILGARYIPIPYTLADPEGDPVGSIRAWYSLNGGGQWASAVPDGGTQTANFFTLGKALRFDGVNDYVSTPLNINQSTTSKGVTMMAWIYPTDDSADRHQVISTDNSGFDWSILRTGSEWCVFTGSTSFHTGLSVDLNQWQHIAAVFDRTAGRVTFYKNGQSASTTNMDYDSSDALLVIGDNPSDAYDEYFAGLIDEVSVWSRPLNATEVLANQEQRLSGLSAGLSGFWDFNEGRGLTAYDRSPRGRDATLVGGPAYETARLDYTFTWDTFASEFFGQSDNVVFRIEAYSTGAAPAAAGTYQYFNSTPLFQHPYTSAATFPFRVRGTQVRVMHEDGATPAAQAAVYRLEKGANGRAAAIAPAYTGGEPYHTNSAGYLLGHGKLNRGDRLVALWPAVITDTYTLYYTSAAPNHTNLNYYTVTSDGVQTLTVSSANPLLLFNLDVSLQWDARYDPAYLQQLESDLQRASELLYDWTDGQAALGDIHLYQNRERWNDAHIRIYASNDLRPMALQGGIVSEVVTDTQVITITYGPGQVHLGAVWNRYGAAGGSLGEDWPRALAHELGHYALYLNDNYIGLVGGNLMPVETCPGAMSDPYRGDAPYSEFHTAVGWSDYCDSTLSNQTTRRDDWSTIRLFYSLLQPQNNPGPAYLPLDVTRILQVAPASDPSPIADPTFYTIDEMQQRLIPGPAARAFLFQDGWAINLGNVVQDHVLARGARPGDELCISDLPRQQAGCATIALNQEQLTLYPVGGWQPEVLATPVNSTTLQVAVSGVPLESLQVSLYPFNGPLTGTLSISASGVVTFHLAAPVWEGYLRLVDSASPNRQTIVDFAIGGNPSSIRGSSGVDKGSSIRGSSSSIRGSSAPVMSADGQVILFTDETALGDDQFYVLQAAAAVPNPLPWATPVGKAYILNASVNAPDLSQAAISFGYNPLEVPALAESRLSLYFRPLAGGDWQILPTQRDAYNNMASAPCQGQGWYVLMSSMRIPLETGWNLFGYPGAENLPISATLPVSQALSSIAGVYQIVYGYDPAYPNDPWQVYGVDAPGWVNDLELLTFGHGYWISVTQPVTLYLGVNDPGGARLSAAAAAETSLQPPPATFYGALQEKGGFIPQAGMPIGAWVQDESGALTLCGQSALQLAAGQTVYVIHVNAASPENPACGRRGLPIRFQVDGRWLPAGAVWNNDRTWELPLSPGFELYLPAISR